MSFSCMKLNEVDKKDVNVILLENTDVLNIRLVFSFGAE